MENNINIISVEKDGEYYRVYWKIGTHKLHSEKLNLETAVMFAHTMMNRAGIR